MRKPPSNKLTIDLVRAQFNTRYQVVDRGHTTPCWEWFKVDPTCFGYGVITISNKKYRAHRLAWMLFRGDIPAGLCVCHNCDNPPCANPDHLFLGTKLDNTRDMERKGRGVHIKGVVHPLAKLTDDDVRYIRSVHKKGYHSPTNGRRLAAKFGVQQSLIYRIVTRESWPHVE